MEIGSRKLIVKIPNLLNYGSEVGRVRVDRDVKTNYNIVYRHFSKIGYQNSEIQNSANDA